MTIVLTVAALAVGWHAPSRSPPRIAPQAAPPLLLTRRGVGSGAAAALLATSAAEAATVKMDGLRGEGKQRTECESVGALRNTARPARSLPSGPRGVFLRMQSPTLTRRAAGCSSRSTSRAAVRFQLRATRSSSTGRA
eukprot:5636333-Prymnesium_polylepis.1